MGLLERIIDANSNPANRYGRHSIDTNTVLNGVSGGITAESGINWEVAAPTVIDTPAPVSMRDADHAEYEAARLEAGVSHATRKLRAEGKKQSSFAKLVVAHRQYLSTAAQAHFDISAANRGLAGKLHGLREASAQLGHSLDRKEETTNNAINQIAMKYRGV